MGRLASLATYAAALALGFGLLFPAMVEARNSCFKRDYTPTHLAKNPNQHIAKLRIGFVETSKSGAAMAFISGRFADQGRAKMDRVQGQFFQQTAHCLHDGAQMTCRVECDGGAFTVTELKGDTLEISTEFFVLQQGEGCEPVSDLAELGGGQTLYRLNRASESECPPN